MEPGETTLLELLDRVVDKGVWLRGDLTIAVAGVDLLYIGLQAVLSSVARLKEGAGVHIRPDSGGERPDGGGTV
ncbi:MAG TPA: gas vesicle protein [Symbiobacteriaceae bacterium]|nr:gas vesicle protein [Symbiobacteriaceae bacterium]